MKVLNVGDVFQLKSVLAKQIKCILTIQHLHLGKSNDLIYCETWGFVFIAKVS